MERNNAKCGHSTLQGPRVEERQVQSWFYLQPWTSHFPLWASDSSSDWTKTVAWLYFASLLAGGKGRRSSPFICFTYWSSKKIPPDAKDTLETPLNTAQGPLPAPSCKDSPSPTALVIPLTDPASAAPGYSAGASHCLLRAGLNTNINPSPPLPLGPGSPPKPCPYPISLPLCIQEQWESTQELPLPSPYPPQFPVLRRQGYCPVA